MLAKIVGTGGSVLALEPNHHNVAVGGKNKELNGVEHLRIVRGAIAENSGTIAMNRTLNAQVDDGSHEWGIIRVPSFSIDDLCRQYGAPDVLFIDVEGFECHALAGAVNTLKSSPDCFVEVHTGAGLEKFGTVRELLSFFPRERYSLFVRDESQASFSEYIPGSRTPDQRFFLVALHK
jgi:FkbM family methyltransferase